MWMLFGPAWALILVQLIVLPAIVVGGLAVLFRLSQVGSPEWVHRIGGPRTWKFNLWHMMAAVIVAAPVLLAFEAGPTGERLFALTLLALWVLSWFVRTWCNEFVFLMGLRDDDLPGRNDKLIWSIVLVAFAPIGIWLFRSYRLAHWPGPKFVSVSYSPLDPEPARRESAAQPA